MGDVYVYERDCGDFATVGICGRLVPTSCKFEEIANGMSELTLSHPINDDGRYTLLTPGRILKASVPVREVPEVDEDTLEYVTVVEKWYVRSDATKLQRTVFNKRDDQIAAAQQAAQNNDDEDANKIKKKKLKVLKKGAKVTVVYNYGDLYPEYRVRCGKVTGYIDKNALRDKVTESYSGMYSSIDKFYDKVEPSWTCKDQLFRIYSVKRENDQIVVNARHIFYDLSYTLTTYDATGSHTLAYTLNQCKAKKIGSWRITFRTNIKGSLSGAHYRDKNMIEAILDPDEGMASRWRADVIRDNYDCYLIGQAGFDRGVVLEYGKDLLGVEYNVNWENVVTHVRPVGENKDGKPLYLSGGNGLVVSSHASNYPFSRVGILKVSDAKVQKDVMTVAEARARLRAAANELLANGADMPEISMKVDFVHLGSTQEYEAYHDLKRLYLFDTVRVRNPRLGVDSSALVKRIVWDCLLEWLDEVELGTVTAIMPSVSSWQLGNVSGAKIQNGTLSGGALEDDAISVRHMQAGSVNADAIQARVITSEHIAAGSIQTEHLQAASVTADQIAAGAITAEKLDADAVSARMLSAFNAVIRQLDAGHVQAQTLGAAIADLGVLTARSATFDAATVQHLVAEALNLEFGAMGEVFIRNLKVAYAQMVSAAIGNLCIKASDGNYYSIDVAADGTVAATRATVTEGEISAGQTSGGRAILETDITAASLNTGNLLATYALVNRIDAARIDVDTLFARQAFIDRLNTSVIQSPGFINLVVGSVDGSVEEAMKDATPAVLRIDSSRGTVFKDNQVNTVLSVVIHYGPNRIEDTTALHTHFGNGAYLQWEWLRLDEERFGILSGSDSRLSDGGFKLTLTPADVDTKVTFRCSLITGS